MNPEPHASLDERRRGTPQAVSPDGYYAVIGGDATQASTQSPQSTSSAQALDEGSEGAEQSVPEPRTHGDVPAGRAQAVGQQPKRFPYDDGVSAAHLLMHKMPAEEFDKMVSLLVRHRDSRTAVG